MGKEEIDGSYLEISFHKVYSLYARCIHYNKTLRAVVLSVCIKRYPAEVDVLSNG